MCANSRAPQKAAGTRSQRTQNKVARYLWISSCRPAHHDGQINKQTDDGRGREKLKRCGCNIAATRAPPPGESATVDSRPRCVHAERVPMRVGGAYADWGGCGVAPRRTLSGGRTSGRAGRRRKLPSAPPSPAPTANQPLASPPRRDGCLR